MSRHRVCLAGATGATGVIGRRVVPLLVAAGHRVTAVGRAPDKRAALERAGAAAIELDLFDLAAVGRAVAGHDVVINLATHIPPSARAFVPGAWRENNRMRRLASHNLATAVLSSGAGRFIQESFAPIYGDAGDRWIDEDAPVRVARYNRAVLDAEAAAARVNKDGGTGVVLRFSYFYGADSDFTRDAMRYVRRWLAMLAGSLGETLARSQRIANRKLRAASGWAPRHPSVVEGWRAVVAALRTTLKSRQMNAMHI